MKNCRNILCGTLGLFSGMNSAVKNSSDKNQRIFGSMEKRGKKNSRHSPPFTAIRQKIQIDENQTKISNVEKIELRTA